MLIKIITIFPDIFQSYFNESIIKRARDKGVIDLEIIDLRRFTTDKHKTVDDTPYGGGAGMVMKIEPLCEAIKFATKRNIIGRAKELFVQPKRKIILLSAKGRTWRQATAVDYAKADELILICGRYEGVDERIVNFIDEEIAIGDYVLTGGELGAMVMVDSITRLLPGALGNEASSRDESHSQPGVLEYPHYTRPAKFQNYQVPEVLLSGDHQAVDKWREENRKQKI